MLEPEESKVLVELAERVGFVGIELSIDWHPDSKTSAFTAQNEANLLCMTLPRECENCWF
jgi:hypothetical protein